MRWDDIQGSDNVEDRRGMGFRVPGGGAGGIGIGGLIIVGLISWATGINPALLLGGADAIFGDHGGQQQAEPGRTGRPQDQTGRFVSAVLGSTEQVWGSIFQQRGERYRPPRLVLYDRATSTRGCGIGQAAMGPFYCPGDQQVYLDTSFFDELRTRFRAPGESAEAYVIAHEIGHHVQNLIGVLPKVNEARQNASSRAEANALSVRVELQADCFAGVWAYYAAQKGIFEPGDVEKVLAAATAIGDDKLQQQAQGRVVPDSFTHGSSAQRVRWFRTGMNRGSPRDCDTFRGNP